MNHLFLTLLESGKSKILAVVDLVCSKSLLPHGEGSLWGLFIRMLIPFMRAPFSGCNCLPNTPPPNAVILRIRFLHMIWTLMNIQSILLPKRTEILEFKCWLYNNRFETTSQLTKAV